MTPEQISEMLAKTCFDKLVPIGVVSFSDQQDAEYIEAIKANYSPILKAYAECVEALRYFDSHFDPGMDSPTMKDMCDDALKNLTITLKELEEGK